MIEFITSIFFGMFIGIYIASQIAISKKKKIRKNKFMEKLNEFNKKEKK